MGYVDLQPFGFGVSNHSEGQQEKWAFFKRRSGQSSIWLKAPFSNALQAQWKIVATSPLETWAGDKDKKKETSEDRSTYIYVHILYYNMTICVFQSCSPSIYLQRTWKGRTSRPSSYNPHSWHKKKPISCETRVVPPMERWMVASWSSHENSIGGGESDRCVNLEDPKPEVFVLATVIIRPDYRTLSILFIEV